MKVYFMGGSNYGIEDTSGNLMMEINLCNLPDALIPALIANGLQVTMERALRGDQPSTLDDVVESWMGGNWDYI